MRIINKGRTFLYKYLLDFEEKYGKISDYQTFNYFTFSHFIAGALPEKCDTTGQILSAREDKIRISSIISEHFKRFRDFSSGSECDAGSQNVIILTIHFCKVIIGFK